MTTSFIEQVQVARRQQQAGSMTMLDALLRGSVDAQAVLLRLKNEAGVDVLDTAEASRADFSRLPVEQCRVWQCVPLREPGGPRWRLAMADPWDDKVLRQATAALGEVPELLAATTAQLQLWLAAPASITAPAARRDAGGPVVAFVDSAIEAGFRGGASDIHFECSRAGVIVKLRQDGVMRPFAQLDDVQRASEVISRIKVLAQLDITETRMPQDGRFRFQMPEGPIDLRVSIMPSVFGEDAVLRLLDKAQLRGQAAAVSLDLLGFDAESAKRIRELAELPHGMLLVTGPTGSGKTTTVYATLAEINTGMEKIITIEDPVEYELPGVLQIPVNERKGLTFAKGLRSILRHDPDRILVGEIRDAETAEIAVQSALTGHQVFTTVHANSIYDVTGRFRHFGLDMFGFMASLNGVVVQRLVRRLCPHCTGARAPTERESHWLASLGFETRQVPDARGCEHCNETGYRGRLVIAEVHLIDDGFRDLVIGLQPVSMLRRHVEAQGTSSLSDQAARLVLGGITSAEEIKRVVGWH